MNSTTSIDDQQLFDDISIGDEFYVPFWIVLPFLDVAPPDPFIKMIIIEKKWNIAVSSEGPVETLCCDLKCSKQHIIANDIPASYLIKLSDIGEWANKIADWFRNFPISNLNHVDV